MYLHMGLTSKHTLATLINQRSPKQEYVFLSNSCSVCSNIIAHFSNLRSMPNSFNGISFIPYITERSVPLAAFSLPQLHGQTPRVDQKQSGEG